MHILLIHQAFLGEEEAGGTRHYELGRYLAARGHKLSVIASQISYLTGKKITGIHSSEGIDVYRAYTYSALHKSYLQRAISFISFMISSFWSGLRIRNLDLVWGTSPPLFQAFPAYLLAKLKGVPFVFEIRDLWPAFPVDLGVLRNKPIIWLAEQIELYFYQKADHLVINSPGFKSHLVGKGIPLEKISTIPNGVDLNDFPLESDGSDFRAQYQLGSGLVILYAGAHGLANDLEIVLKAAELMKNQSQVSFVFVGDGKQKADLVRLAESKDLVNIKFIPAQPKVNMPDVLAAADICLAVLRDIPTFKTTYPNKVFDYMAAGKPTLLMIDGVIRKVIEDSEGGLFVKPGDPAALVDAVKLLAGDPVRREQMGRNARRYVEKHFQRSDQALELERLILDLLNKE
jgi:glycosyltransferase involved in cell wall biosynthesis